MWNIVKRFISPPIFPEDEEKTRVASLLNIMLWLGVFTSLIALLFTQILVVPENRLSQFLIYVLQIILWILLHAALRRGWVRAAGLVFTAAIYISMTVQLFLRADISSGVGVVNFFLIVSIATLLLHGTEVVAFTLLSILSLLGVLIATQNGWITPRLAPPTPFATWVFYSVVYLVVSVILYISSGSLRSALRRVRESEAVLAGTNSELQSLNQNLEERVALRTAELEQVNQSNQRRAHLFAAVAQVARVVTSMHDLDRLLPEITDLISRHFGYYHVGIFLIDEAREYAVLSAANSEGGKRMLERAHKLRIGQVGIVGYVTDSGNPRIALDTGTDAVFFNNPDLPQTRSEMALPLRIESTVIGALDVQSTLPNAFGSDDIAILTTLADQVAVAIQNARLFRETQNALADSQALFGNYVRQTWKSASQSDSYVGYRFSGTSPVPMQDRVTTPEIRAAFENGKTVSPANMEGTLAVPVKLRDEIIGVLNVKTPTGRAWDPDEIDIMEAAAERVALALESAVLLEETQRRASRERAISEMSAKIISGTEIESILRTTVEELGRQIGGAQITLELESNE